MIRGVPKGLHRQVREAFIAHLKDAPALANNRVIRTWIGWDDPKAPPQVQVGDMPALMVQVVGGASARFAGARGPGGPIRAVNKETIQVHLTLSTAGCDAGDLEDVGDLIREALAPQEPNRRAALDEKFRRAGIRGLTQVRPFLPSSAESFTDAWISGTGVYEFTTFVAS